MAQPQRGQEEQLPPHTVPQEEQVLQPQFAVVAVLPQLPLAPDTAA